MTVKTIPALEARMHLGEIMKRSYKNGERFIIEKSGIPMVVILNASEYTRIIEEREARFAILDQIRTKIPETTEEEIKKDIDKTIQTIRKNRA